MKYNRRTLDLTLATPLLVLWLVIAIEFVAITYANGGRFLFSIDDVYINLGLARRFFAGISPKEFPSGTTAFGWSLLFGALSTFINRGAIIFSVLALNIAMASWFVILLHSQLKLLKSKWLTRIFLLFAIFLVNPPELIFIGMEHIVHITLLVAGLIALKKWLDDGQNSRQLTLLCVYTFLAACCRLETIFFAAAVSFILLIRRSPWWAAGLVCTAITPVVVQGLFQIHQGASFWSNPIAIKTVLEGDAASKVVGTFLRILRQPTDVILIEAAIITVLFVTLKREKPSTSERSVSDLCIIALLYAALHVTFADVGWLGRYQSPIIAIGVLTLAEALAVFAADWQGGNSEFWSYRSIAEAVLALSAFWMIMGTDRFRYMLLNPAASWDVRNQMCRTEEIVASAPVKEYVILNDVGCTTFYTDNPIIDLYGLTSYETRLLGGKTKVTKQDIAHLAQSHGAKMAIIYKTWFEGRIPDEWIPVGHWTVTWPMAYGADKTVTVYATSPAFRQEIAARWNAYRQRVGTIGGLKFASP
jgi:hypothetical protein